MELQRFRRPLSPLTVALLIALAIGAVPGLAHAQPAAGSGPSVAASPLVLAADRTVVAADAQTAAQDVPKAKPEKAPVRAELDHLRPTLKLGDWFEVGVGVKLHFDARWFDPEPDDPPDDYEIPLRRIAVAGKAFKIVEFEVEGQVDTEDPWRDVYVNVQFDNAFQVQGGKFKEPFGRERLTGRTSLDFVERTTVTSSIAPGRHVGGMVHGRVKQRAFTYAVGYFKRNEISDAQEDDEQAPLSFGATIAARATVRPFRLAGAKGWYEPLDVGVSFAGSTVPEGLLGTRGRAIFRQTFFPEVYVLGDRRRFGVDGALVAGPFSVQAEYLRLTDQRLGQGLGDEDLPDLLAHGWYAQGTWVVTGEPKANVETPRKPLFRGGFGAIELATRFEKLRLKSVETLGEPPFRNPRAVNLYPNSDTGWVGGVNWYIDRWFRVQFDAIREKFEDPDRTLSPPVETFWSYVLRLQFVM